MVLAACICCAAVRWSVARILFRRVSGVMPFLRFRFAEGRDRSFSQGVTIPGL